MIKKTIKNRAVEELEKVSKKTVEHAKQNFTLISKELINEVFGSEIISEKKPKNFTAFDESIRKQMGENFGNQDNAQLDEIRRKLASESEEKSAVKKQLEHMRKEEKEAQEYIKAKEDKHKQEDEEEMQRKAQEEQRKQAAAVSDIPQGKQQRGSLFSRKKKPKKTIENKPAQGKQ